MVEQNLWSKQTTVHFVFREWDLPEGLDRVCLEMGLGGGNSEPSHVQLRRTLNRFDLICLLLGTYH